MSNKLSLDGRKMHVVSTDRNGEVGIDTVFEFRQRGRITTAQYAGGRIAVGFLVGTISDSSFEFRYAQANVDGHLDGGKSQCEIETTSDGKLRLLEHFSWESRAGSGTNIFEEL